MDRLTKRKVVIAVVCVSVFWLLLDVYLFYNAGRSKQGHPRNTKLPADSDIDAAKVERVNDLFNSSVINEQHPASTWEITIEDVPTTPATRTDPPRKKHIFIPILDYNVRTLPFTANSPGENGRSVRIAPTDEALIKEGFRLASFNQHASDLMSFERSIPDARPSKCRDKSFEYASLPKMSVIICFTEESWSTLLRSVHSVLNRTPPELLEEVILVDDFSQREHLHDKLDRYIAKLPKVTLIRLTSRQGLIRARLKAIKIARGPVLTFLDSHIECNVGWAEPLLQRISRSRHIIVAPIIDAISSKDFSYIPISTNQRGGFNWVMLFKWMAVPDYEKSRIGDDNTAPIRTPTIAGGLFAIHKGFFQYLGLYDPGLDIWGSENLELSFKAWMCGGTMEMVPCSRVGHVYRNSQPYTFPGGNVEVFMRNNLRVANVWMDDYVNLFYMMKPELRDEPFGDISERVKLRHRLQCHDFKWYLNNVIPELNIPSLQLVASGELQNIGLGLCLDSAVTAPQTAVSTPVLKPCHHAGGNQEFRFSVDGTIENGVLCLSEYGMLSQMISCTKLKQWKFRHTKGGVIQSLTSGFCLDVERALNGVFVPVLSKCYESQIRQQWRFQMYHRTQ